MVSINVNFIQRKDCAVRRLEVFRAFALSPLGLHLSHSLYALSNQRLPGWITLLTGLAVVTDEPHARGRGTHPHSR